MKAFIFGGKGSATPIGDFGLFLLRCFAGLSLAFAHGLGKFPVKEGFVQGVSKLGFPAPEAFAYLSGAAELIGGLLLALGLATRPAAIIIAINMVVAGFLQHSHDPYQKKELAFFYLAIALCFALVGAGRYSVDAQVGGKGK